MQHFKKNFHYKLIYIFSANYPTHSGLLKIGEATVKTNKAAKDLPPNCAELNRAAKKRIKEYTNTAGFAFNLLHTELAVTNKFDAFRDKTVHDVLRRSGYNKKKIKGTTAQEWFKVDLQTAKKAIAAVKQNKKTLDGVKTSEIILPVTFRPEQEKAIKETVQKFKAKKDKMLWNAKMRFGKTFCALEVIHRMKFPKTIIVTHRPVVNVQWFDDFKTIFQGEKNFAYGSKNSGETIENLLRGNKNFVYFASMQDLRGSEIVNGKFEKNAEIFSAAWDLVIVDEAHEGTKTALGDSVIKNLVKEKTKLLALSGTPFNILEEYEENVYTWDYLDEQRAKNDWYIAHGTDSNPYEELPRMEIFTYNLGEILNNPAFLDDEKSFNFKEFFRVENGKFVHEEYIKKFLNLMTKDGDNNYPYTNDEFRNIFQHSLWMIPGVKEGRALSKLLKQHWIFKNFEIINVAGDGDADEESKDALKKVQDAIARAEKSNRSTITLSCGKLTTGVTVPEWTAVFMLAGGYSTSAAAYMQTIFRVQSPCRKNGMFKDICYVFDFAPDRSLKFISESVIRTGGNRAKLQEYLNFCPVISLQGSKMIQYDTNKLFQTLKRVQAARVVKNGFDDSNLYNGLLFQLDKNALEKFDKLKGIIGTSKAQKKTGDIDITDSGLKGGKKSDGEKSSKEKDKEFEKAKKNRRTAISILRGISIRMPLLIYGADIPFTEDFTIEMFFDDKIIDAESWKEFMPKGVTKEIFRDFVQYYDQDIFIAAGRDIRNRAKNADALPPTERVKKIAELFSCFKNPDKETVLTPFRVVNLHLSCALGGFDFFDDNHENISAEPRFVHRGKVTSQTLANPAAQILEINSKTGLYPLYVAYSLYRAKLREPEDVFDLEYLQDIWDSVLAENVFVICKTPMAKTITRRTLAGFRHKNINAEYIDDLINCLKSAPADFISCITAKNFWNKGVGIMKFDAVVGNPPYQETSADSDNETFAAPVYQLFLETTFKLKTKTSLIHPARFLFNAGATPKDFNRDFLNNPNVKIVHYTPRSWELFPNTDIKGGVAISYFDPDEKFEPIKIFTPFEELNSFYKKVIGSENFSPISEIMRGQMTFRLSEKAYKDFPDLPQRLPKRTDTALRTNAFEILPDIFLEEKPNDGNEYFQILGKSKGERVYRFVRRDYMIDIPEFYDYKVFIPKSNGSGMIGEKLSTPLVGSTQTFIGFYGLHSAAEAEACLKYVKTKFARALLGILKITQDNPPATWACVPLQDFTAASDIDWSRSIAEIDNQLYEKYKLSKEEKNFIEEKVTAMG